MEYVLKEKVSSDLAGSSRVAQGRFARDAAQSDIVSHIDNSPHMIAQRKKLQGMFGGTVQLQVAEEEPLQGKFASTSTAHLEQQPAAKPNNTGLPDNLKTGIESLSGISMDNVKVHYNSPQPAQLNALAYAQGSDIHVAPGQERHLPHEAWHVVQQAQGRVKPTMQMKDGLPVNDDAELEHEADRMGDKAAVGVLQAVGHKVHLVSVPRAIVQKYIAPTVLRFAELGIGRAHNAGIVDVNSELGTGLRFTEHYHCNGWVEATRTFASFTGTFTVGNTTYHFTIVDGGAAAWTQIPGTPPDGARAFQTRTENKLRALISTE